MSDLQGELFVSVDCEADGPVPGEYSMLSVGAAARPHPNRPPVTFYRELRPISERFVQEALDVCKLDRTSLALYGAAPGDAMGAFAAWVAQVSAMADAARSVFVGFNATFDWQFVNWYFHKYHGRNPFGIAGLDIKAYYMGKFDTTWGATAKSRMPKELRPKLPHTHNAKDDALEQLVLWELVRSAI